MIKIKINTSLLSLCLIVVGVLAVWGVVYFFGHTGVHCTSNTYEYLNSALDCESQPAVSKAQYLTFKKNLEADIATWQAEGRVEEVAVFFRDLENGPTFGINDRQGFIPASLLKVPIMFTYFKLAEDDPAVLQKTLIWSGESTLDVKQSVPDELLLKEDTPYTIDELVFRMIVYSDNHSARLLEAYASTISPEPDPINQTYYDLGLLDPKDHSPGDALSAKSYSALFRLLYNASYLSNEFSDKALGLLAKAEFDEGIAGGVPEGTTVANKFGERLENEYIQLHDCGIIYYPKNPYLLCVMTRGVNYEELKAALRDVSKAVWNEVEGREL